MKPDLEILMAYRLIELARELIRSVEGTRKHLNENPPPHIKNVRRKKAELIKP